MATGTVKWFNDTKGFGFIIPDDGSAELFAHYSAIQGRGFKSLKEGQKVSFEVTRGPKGLAAGNIIPVRSAGLPGCRGSPGSLHVANRRRCRLFILQRRKKKYIKTHLNRVIFRPSILLMWGWT